MVAFQGQKIEIGELCAQWLTILNTSDISYNIERLTNEHFDYIYDGDADNTNFAALPNYVKLSSYVFQYNGTKIGIINQDSKEKIISQRDYFRLNSDVNNYFNLSTYIVSGDILDADIVLRDYYRAMYFMDNRIKYFVGVNADSNNSKPQTCISALYVPNDKVPQNFNTDITFQSFLTTPNVQIIRYQLSNENT